MPCCCPYPGALVALGLIDHRQRVGTTGFFGHGVDLVHALDVLAQEAVAAAGVLARRLAGARSSHRP